MSEFITLLCPTCGELLRLEPRYKTHVCWFCGRRLKLRDSRGRGLLEKPPVCPVCGSNDRVMKLAVKNTENPEFRRRYNLPSIPTKQSIKAAHVKPPRLPKRTKPLPPNPLYGVMILVSGTLSLILLIKKQLVPKRYQLCFYPVWLFYLFTGFLAIWGISEEFADRANQCKMRLYRARVARYEQNKLMLNFYRKYEEELLKWERSKIRYELVNYCERDDIVFIPGLAKSFRVEDMPKLLYQDELAGEAQV
jgi:predicted RNA-binding Zn-ribbon protein involved in translation (DUF1610 family)